MAFPQYTPPQLGPNPYQIAGQAATQLGGQIQQFGNERDKVRMAYEDMVQKRKDKILADQRAQEEFQLRANADERAAAEAKRQADLAASRETFLKDFTGSDPADPANQVKLRQALTSGIIDKGTYDVLNPPAPKPPSVGSFEDFVTQQYGARPTAEQIAEGRRAYGESGRDFVTPQALDEDIEYFADAVANATMAPSEVARMLSSRRGDKLKIMRQIYERADQINPGVAKYSPAELDIAYRQAVNPANQRTVAIIDNVLMDFPFIVETSRLAKRSGIPAVNKHLLNARYALGDRSVTDFKTLQAALAEEIGGALGGGSVTSDFKIKYGERMLNGDLGPEEFESAMKYVTKLLENRKRAIAKTMGPYGNKHIENLPPQGSGQTATDGDVINLVRDPNTGKLVRQ